MVVWNNVSWEGTWISVCERLKKLYGCDGRVGGGGEGQEEEEEEEEEEGKEKERMDEEAPKCTKKYDWSVGDLRSTSVILPAFEGESKRTSHNPQVSNLEIKLVDEAQKAVRRPCNITHHISPANEQVS
jgi:hypothetical protein